jgi:P4 family phage/plasmid primase-like protien
MSASSTLLDFLRKHRVFGTDTQFNLTTLYSKTFQNGRYYISPNDRDEFINVYYKYVFVEGNHSTCLECPFKESNRPSFDDTVFDSNLIKIDLDIHNELSKDENSRGIAERHYTVEDMEMLIQSYIDKFNKYIHFPKDFQLFLLEKEKPCIVEKNGKRHIKDGVHIISNGYVVPNAILHQVRSEILDDPEIIEMFEENIKPMIPIKQVVDESVIQRNNWFLYGSGKPNDMVYKVTHIYSVQGGKLRELEIPDNTIELIKAMSHLYAAKSVKIRETAILTELTARATNATLDIERSMRIKSEMKKLGNDPKGPTSEVFSVEYINKLLACINTSRAVEYGEWWKIGQALYNIDCRNGNIFIDFSRRAGKNFSEEACIDHWLTKFPKDSFKYSALHIHHLRKIAGLDYREEYEKIEKILSTKVIDEILTTFKQSIYEKKLGETTLSKLIKKYLDTNCNKQYVCVVGDKGARQWFVYDHNKWNIDKGGVHIQSLISNEVLLTFIKTNSNFHMEASNIHSRIVAQKTAEFTRAQRAQEERSDFSSEEEIKGLPDNRAPEEANLQLEQSAYTDKAKIAERIVIHLEETRHRDTLVKNLGILYNDSDFYSKIDTNPYVFVCKNGVLDLKELCFRPGRPEDLTTKSCKINYVTMDEIVANPELQEYSYQLQDFLDQVLTDSGDQNYLLNIIAECLCGVVRREELYINEGKGSNGKSKLFDLIETTFGDYAGKTNTALFTHKRESANSPTPAIVELCGKRLVSCQEPDDGSKLSTGIVKELSGGDKLQGRDLNMPLKTFTPSHRIFMMCNDKPDIDSTDDGTWRRMRNIRYNSKFVDADDPRLLDPVTYPNHFKKDSRVPDKFFKWAPILLHNLFERYKELTKTNFNIVIPESIQSAIREYKADHNIYASFVRDKMVKSPGDRLDVKTAFAEFVLYAKESNFKVATINKNIFQTNIERIMETETASKGKWRGWVLTNYSSQETQDSETDAENKKKKSSKNKHHEKQPTIPEEATETQPLPQPSASAEMHDDDSDADNLDDGENDNDDV